jgi:hypothetical protein
MNVARESHTATLLRDGSVLVAGGSTWAPGLGVTKSAELYGPPPGYIDAGFTGAWYDPAQSGHGIFIEVLPDYRLLAWWFTFNPAGTEQAWFGGVGTYSLNSATITDVVQTTGGRWIPNFDKTQVANHPWGSLSITFSDDSHGRADFSGMPGYGSGSMALTRLTQLAPPKGTGTWIGSPGAVTSERFGGDKPNVYFSSSPDLVYKLDPTNKLTRIAGTGIPGYSGDGGPAAQAQLNFPLSYPELESHPHDYYPLVGGLATDLYANLYIADAYNNRVRKIDSNGIISTFAGNGSRANAGDGGVATNASIYWPQGVAADFSGNVYVASQFGSLRKVAPGGGISTVTGSNCGPGFLGPGLCVPEQISADTNGNVYVPDGYCRVRKVQPDGSVVTVAGDDTHPGGGFAFTCGFTGDGGPATSAALSLQPYAVAADYVGHLYIADTFNSCIRKVTSAGIISTFAGTCTSPGFSGDDGPATSAQLDHPYGVSVDPFQVVLIADTGNHRIRKVSATGTITTIAGSGGPGVIGPSFSGAWYDPAQSGHGIFIEVLPGNLLLAWWFTFNPAGTEQAWFGGVGSYNGATATITDVVQTTGGRWIPNFDKTQIVNHPWGSLTFSFTDCNHGKVDFNSVLGYGSGSMNLTRLTTPAGLTCP